MCWHPFKSRIPAASPDALRANLAADRQLEAARATRMDAHEVSLQLQRSRNNNHFAESFEQAMRGPKS